MTEQLARFQRSTRHLEHEACLNCATVFSGKYCPGCGQESYTGAPTAWGFIYEFLTRNVFEGGKLWKTLWHLLRYPGGLTVDFLEGRRERYIRPVRLFLGISAIYFFALIFGSDRLANQTVEHFQASQQKSAVRVGKTDPAASIENGVAKLVRLISMRLPEGEARQRGMRFLALSDDEQLRNMMKGEFAATNKATFFMLPVFALLLKLLLVRRNISYGTHLLFTFHVQSFSYLIYLMVLFLPFVFNYMAMVISLVYLVLALKRVYVCNWPASVWLALAVTAGTLVMLDVALFVFWLSGVFWPL